MVTELSTVQIVHWLANFLDMLGQKGPPGSFNHFKTIFCLELSSETFKLKFSCPLNNNASLVQPVRPNHTYSKNLSEQIGL